MRLTLAIWYVFLLSPFFAQRYGQSSLGYHFDVQRMDYFHTLSFQQAYRSVGVEVYAGCGHRNTLSNATFFPQVGLQGQWFPLAEKTRFFQGFHLHVDYSMAYLAKPFSYRYSRFQLGYGIFWPVTKKLSFGQLRITHQFGIAWNQELQRTAQVRSTFLDHRFSLGLNYVLPK